MERNTPLANSGVFRMFLVDTFVGNAMIPIFNISLPILAITLGVDPFQVGLVGGASNAVYTFMPFVMGHFSDIRKSGSFSRVIKIVEADISDTGIPSMSVDVALFANILHDLENPSAFLKEVGRLVKNDSLVIDIDWRKSKSEHGPPMEIRLTERKARSVLSQNGLKVVRKIDAGPFHYGLVCCQP